MFATVAIAVPAIDSKMHSMIRDIGYIDYENCETVLCGKYYENDKCQYLGCGPCPDTSADPPVGCVSHKSSSPAPRQGTRNISYNIQSLRIG